MCYSDGSGVEVFHNGLALQHFSYLLASLRFDDKITRPVRRSADKLAPIRNIFDRFVPNCTANYSPSVYVTVDEILARFWGRCPFRQYFPSKPAKYGMNILALADAETHYLVNLEVYAGKQPPGPYEENNSPAAVSGSQTCFQYREHREMSQWRTGS